MNGNRVISVGIFFDGTGNNGVNILSPDKPLNNNESYYGTFSNIYKLYSLFVGDKKIYIEGIGTVTGHEDNNFAMATCANPPYGSGYSSDDKLRKAGEFVQKIAYDDTKEYHFYVYGFGRGGMLARTLCNQLLTHYAVGNCRIKFLGLFDTVESKPFNTYNMNMSVQIENALHFCAANEGRFFFPLTGLFENSKTMKDQKSEKKSSVWKEVFVPGDHADIGGGYLEGPQSVYISTDFANVDDLHSYVSDIRNAKTSADGNKIWDALLSEYKVETVNGLSQAFVCRDKVYNDLSKVYGKLMMDETNIILSVFSTENEAYFGTDYNKHSFLSRYYSKMKEYLKDLSGNKKPIYDFGRFAEYTHISSNFGLYSNSFRYRTQREINIELINNGLNVSSSTSVDETSRTKRLSVELHLPEDSFVADFLYGTNVPNNDIWLRSIVKTPAAVRVNE